MATPISVPKVQTDDRDLTQLQSNIINALQPMGLQINQLTVIGEIKSAALTISQFQSQAGSNWAPCSGQNIATSAYSKTTGTYLAPTIAPVGNINYFIRIN